MYDILLLKSYRHFDVNRGAYLFEHTIHSCSNFLRYTVVLAVVIIICLCVGIEICSLILFLIAGSSLKHLSLISWEWNFKFI